MAEPGLSPEGGLSIRFDRSLYAKTAVQAAVQAFSGFATISLVEDPSGWTAVLAEPDPRHADVLVDELANYALSETAAGQRAGAVV